MALTDFSDVFASVHEKAINNVVLQLQRQRPSIFNYGTQFFVDHPDLLCHPLLKFIDQDVILFNNPVVHKEGLLTIPGYNGAFGLEFCLQLSELSIDFHKGNVHILPPELGPLKPQQFSLKARVCVGLGCPEPRILDHIAPVEQPYFPILKLGDFVTQSNKPADKERDPNKNEKPTEPPSKGIPFRAPICVCLDLYAVFTLQREGSVNDPILSLKLQNLEIVDVKPNGLENIVECFIKTMLIMSVLPKVKIALRALVFNIADVLNIEPTPISATVPFNPAVEDDQVKIFVNLTV